MEQLDSSSRLEDPSEDGVTGSSMGGFREGLLAPGGQVHCGCVRAAGLSETLGSGF